MSRRIFVIRDFEIKGIDISLEDLRRTPPEGYDEVIIPGLSGGRTQGQIFDDAVRRELTRASHVLAFVDLPNANVGFELGYALGLGKPTALARVAAQLPAWLTEPPLAGYLAPAARSAEAFRQLICSDHWIEPPAKPAPGQGVLFMCPESGEGASIHESRRRCQPDWRVLPTAGWSLPDLRGKLDGIGKVVWCILPYAKDTDERDGRENAADAIVAGFASACGLELTVLRHGQARPVADLQQWEHRFSTLDEFERLLRPPAAERAPPARQGGTDSVPALSPRPEPGRRRWLAASLVATGVLAVAGWLAAGNAGVQRLVAQLGFTTASGRAASAPPSTVTPRTPKDRRWPNGSTVTVSFMGGKAQDHEQVKRHAKLWTVYANINFAFVEPGTQADVRIAFDPSMGSWSQVGTDSKAIEQGQPTMNLGWVDAPTVLHQFGHVLGLLHEHQNPNARFEWNSALMMKELRWDQATLEMNVTRRLSPDDYVIPKPFDPYSVMLYTFPASWTNGIVLRQGQSLSDDDKEYIAKLYPGRWAGK